MSGLEPLMIAALAATAAAGATSAYGAVQQGRAADEESKFIAAQQHRESVAAQAQGAQLAVQARRESSLKIGRAKALAGQTFGDADSGIVEQISRLRAEGDYNVAGALFTGAKEASSYRDAARATRWSGRIAKRAGRLKAATTVLETVGSMGAMYAGMKKPNPKGEGPSGYNGSGTSTAGNSPKYRRKF